LDLSSFQGVKVNQDGWVAVESYGGTDALFFAVFDGHGEHGHHVSNFLGKNLLSFSVREMRQRGTRKLTEQVLHGAFTSCNEALQRHDEINVHMSGSTCISVAIQDGELITANLGDSRALLGSFRDAAEVSRTTGRPLHESADQLVIRALSEDHTPELESEAKRILASGGEIRPLLIRGAYYGPQR